MMISNISWNLSFSGATIVVTFIKKYPGQRISVKQNQR